MTREELDFVGSMNMCDEISNEAYQKIVCHFEETDPCEDAISRKVVLRLFATHDGKYLYEAIQQLPSVQPKAKTGHWIAQDIHNCHTNFKCSECGYMHDFMHLYGKPTADYTYCPNCGAKMEVEE